MKVFANGFNLYGQLIKPTELLEDFDVVFESEVIKNFGINYSFSYFHTNESLLVFPNNKKDIILDTTNVAKVVSNDDRFIVLYSDGMLVNVEYHDGVIVKNLLKICGTEDFNDKVVNLGCGSKINLFYSDKGHLFTIGNQLNFCHNNIVQIECGREHYLLLDKNGNVYAFGRGSRGQLGHGSLDDETEPVLIEALAGLKITNIAAGGWHSCALSADGDLYTWGWNSNGQLGLSKSDEQESYNVQATPQIVESFDDGLNVIMVAAGNRHTLALLDNKYLFGCGWNKYKQLKNDSKQEYYAFTFLHDFSKEEVLELKTGPWNSAVLCK